MISKYNSTLKSTVFALYCRFKQNTIQLTSVSLMCQSPANLLMYDLQNKWNLTLAQHRETHRLPSCIIQCCILWNRNLYLKRLWRTACGPRTISDSWINRQQRFWVFVPPVNSNGKVSPEVREGEMVKLFKTAVTEVSKILSQSAAWQRIYTECAAK